MAQRNLSVQIEHLSYCVSTQCVAEVITPFEGDPKGFKECNKAVGKHALLTQADADNVKLIVYQSCKGAVSDYPKRYLTEHEGATWAQCKAELTTRFSEVTDPQH